MSGRVNGWLWRAICALVGLVFGAGVAYGTLNHRVSELRDCTRDHETRLRVLEAMEQKVDFLYRAEIRRQEEK